jgi:hypothetical protein
LLRNILHVSANIASREREDWQALALQLWHDAIP